MQWFKNSEKLLGCNHFLGFSAGYAKFFSIFQMSWRRKMRCDNRCEYRKNNAKKCQVCSDPMEKKWRRNGEEKCVRPWRSGCSW